MGFKRFYLVESSSRDYKKLKNIISGAANKEVTTEEKRPNGKYFIIPSVGSWTSFSKILRQELEDLKWKDKSPKSTELKFENEATSLFVKLEKANIMFYLTDKPKQEPEWTDEINNPKEEM